MGRGLFKGAVYGCEQDQRPCRLCGPFSPRVAQSVHRRPLCVLKEEFLLGLFADEVQMPLVSCLPERGRRRVVVDVAGQKGTVVFVAFLVVVTGRVRRVCIQIRYAIDAGKGDEEQDRVAPDGCRKAL